jgi:hypothetical protein
VGEGVRAESFLTPSLGGIYSIMSNPYARYQGNVGYLFLLKLLNG